MKIEQWLTEQLGKDIWDNKYRFKTESFDEWVDRVSAGNEDTKRLIYEKKFLFGGRTLSNRKTGKNASYSNCYSSGYAPDSLLGIMELNTNLAMTYKSQGGQGLSLSKIRPKGTDINGQFESDGILPFMRIFNITTESVSQGGSRKGALLMSLACDHKEINDFISIKTKESSINKANLSVEFDDEFMLAVKEFYETGEKKVLDITKVYEGKSITYKITPIDVYKNFANSSYNWAEPGAIMIQRFRNYNLMEFIVEYEIVTGNPSMPKDVLVATTEGIVNINTLEGKEFYIKSLDGEIAKAQCWLSSANAEVFDIDLGGGRHSYATGKHKYPVLVDGKITRKEVSEIQKGDLIPLNRNELQGYSNDLTEEEGFLAGVFLAESSITKRKENSGYVCMLSVGEADIGVKEKVEFIYNKIVGDSLTFRNRNGTCEATITNKYFIKEILIDKFGLSLSCDGKQIPSSIWESGDNFTLGFIDGLFSCDGNVKVINTSRKQSAQLQFTTSLDNIAKDIQKLLGFYGVSSTLYSRDRFANFPNGKDYGRKYHSTCLNIPPTQTVKFLNIFTLTCKNKLERIKDNLTSKGLKINSITANYIKVMSISSRGKEPVWDITVFHDQHVFPSQHCYTGNCGEQPLPKDGACNLGSMNFSAYVVNPYTKESYFDDDTFVEDVAVAIESLDNVLDEGKLLHALESQRQMANDYRNVGLGYHGSW